MKQLNNLNPKKYEHILFTNIKIMDSKRVQHLEINNNKIIAIHDSMPSTKAELLDLNGAIALPGLIDCHCIIKEPGREDVESMDSGFNAATKGGFTQILLMPNNATPIDTAEMLAYIKNSCQDSIITCHPIGALTKERKGKSIAPFAELANGGAIAFSDGDANIESSSLMQTAFIYTAMLNKKIIVQAADKNLNEKGQMHEGLISTRLGFVGMPSLAEEIIIARDLLISKNCNAPVHFTQISSKESVNLIAQAKKAGQNVSCDVAIHNLIFTEIDIETFNTNFKLNPPLRSKSDRQALINGLKDGTIDCISSAHHPQAWEDKEAEFIYSPFGAISLETCIPVFIDTFINTKIFNIGDMIKFFHQNPAKIFNLKQNNLDLGEEANITFINTNKKEKISKNYFLSKSTNSPYLNRQVTGKVELIINNGKLFKL